MVCDMHRQREDASRNPASTQSPSWTMDQNRYGFLPRWFRTEIFNHCRLFLQGPVHLPCHIDSPPKDAEIFVRSVFDRRRAISHVDQQRTTFQWWRIQVLHERIRLQAPDVLTTCPSFEWIHRGHGEEGESRLQKDGWISKCSSKCIIAVMQHSDHKRLAITSGDFTRMPMPQRHRPVNIQRICRHLLEIQNTQKEHFDWAHWAKDKRFLKVKEQVRFFPQKQYGAKLKWLTGTVRNFGMRTLVHHRRPKR